jgi:hypothetical protein
MLGPQSPKAATLFLRAAATPPALLEAVQAELLGIPVPAAPSSAHSLEEGLSPCGLGLRQLSAIEPLLHCLFLSPMALASIQEAVRAPSAALADIRQTVLAPEDDLTPENNLTLTTTAHSQEKAPPSEDPKTPDPLAQQFLQALTSKLARLNRLLRAAVGLWRRVQRNPNLALHDLEPQDSDRQADLKAEAALLQRQLLEETEWQREPRFLQVSPS